MAPSFLSFFIFFEADTGFRCSLMSTSCSARMVTMSSVLVRRFIENMVGSGGKFGGVQYTDDFVSTFFLKKH